MSQISIIGLGPGSPDLLTCQASSILERAAVLYVTRLTPSINSVVADRVPIVALEAAESVVPVEAERQHVATRIVDLASRQAVVFGCPGNPLTDDPTSRTIRDLARQAGRSVDTVSGVSFLDVTVRALGIDFSEESLQIVGADRLVEPLKALPLTGQTVPNPFLGVYRSVDPTRPVLVRDVYRSNVDVVRQALEAIYPADYLVSVVHPELGPDVTPVVIPLPELAPAGWIDTRSWLYCSPVERLSDVAAFDTLRYIVARLRGPGGCPWDREQTFQSIKKHLIEETYEAVAALDEDDYERFAEELGDVLLQVVMYAQFGREAQKFDLEDVLRSVNAKLVRRHPHVFGNVSVASSAEVLRNWEQIKRGEKKGDQVETISSFAGIPQAAPALMRAEAVQSRATRYGWVPPSGPPDIRAVEAPDLSPGERRERLGELLFDVVALARRYKLDPEEALRLATNRFVDRIERK